MSPREYYIVLGGSPESYDEETSQRVKRFCIELKEKRLYDKFTMFESDVNEMVVGTHLRLFSICEHHLLPFFGQVAIGYIPDGKIFGLSKFQRIVDRFASKPQIQERLTQEIADFIEQSIKPLGVGVVVRAIHTCVFARGTQSASAEFTTNIMRGTFRENVQTRNEFLTCAYSDGNGGRLKF